LIEIRWIDLEYFSALEKIILAGYRALQLCYFFTSGTDEVKAWTIQVGTKAPHAAGRIHTDFEKGFIMAEVMKFEDFKEFGNENAVKVCEFKNDKGRISIELISG
jgi:obg-like ATPase 1